MAAMYVEEAQLLKELLEEFDPENDDAAVIQEAVDEGFLRIDMNYGPEVKANAIDILEQMWDITNQEDLLDTFDFLLKQGHRGKFKALVSHLDNFEKFKQIFEFDFADNDEVQMADEDYESLIAWLKKAVALIGAPSILAWDMARVIHLLRLGVLADYITPEKAWPLIDSVYPVVQGQFKDWKHFAQSYLIGLTFWAGQEDPIVKACCERLFGDPNFSPWVYYKW
ncbi:MAG: DUF1266 domain-containing protein [Bdellovibrionia bacterium]